MKKNAWQHRDLEVNCLHCTQVLNWSWSFIRGKAFESNSYLKVAKCWPHQHQSRTFDSICGYRCISNICCSSRNSIISLSRLFWGEWKEEKLSVKSPFLTFLTISWVSYHSVQVSIQVTPTALCVPYCRNLSEHFRSLSASKQISCPSFAFKTVPRIHLPTVSVATQILDFGKSSHSNPPLTSADPPTLPNQVDLPSPFRQHPQTLGPLTPPTH